MRRGGADARCALADGTLARGNSHSQWLRAPKPARCDLMRRNSLARLNGFACAMRCRSLSNPADRALASSSTTGQARFASAPRKRDQIYGAAATCRLRAMGIRDKPIAPGSPWQNAFAERLIGSIRRECVDHIVVLGEKHLRAVLKSYARYYNETRTHRSLDKDAPISRPVQRAGSIISHALLGGLHHHYVRV